MLRLNKVHYGDCLEKMMDIPDKSIDMILTDPPYGTTACKWDSIIPLDLMWSHLKRIIKDNRVIAITASEPFASKLRMSNLKMYKYDWIWNKKLAGNGILAKIQPLKIHEIICIFGKNKCLYYPQMTKGKLRTKLTGSLKISELNGGDGVKRCKETFNDQYYPISIQEFSLAGLRRKRLHPTQKPVDLMEYLIKTYTNEQDTVLDFTCGSGTTGVACMNTGRNFILIEKEMKYVEIARNRIKILRRNLYAESERIVF